ncbi:hypothetical protein [Bradyrhizobium sp. 186]|uniref:hypothetical protein n=1 Tax=Bradyrhizobium sp. 186 TaxID=2782654 RepID=UPI0020008CEB|nr:hypothetical protein [Bradyrhizobium sp. 186]
MSYGQSPALVAIATKAEISALSGNVMPQLISIPIPVATYKDLKPGTNCGLSSMPTFLRRTSSHRAV